jgi:Cu(I)/Ag(I) efflux system periplasmic protein CusF
MPSQSLFHGQGLATGRARHVSEAKVEQRRRSLWQVSWVVGLVALAGCGGAYRPPALTTQHPAHPEATVAPDLPPSTTLAYTPADLPSARPAATARGAEGALSAPHTAAHIVVGEGKVIAVVPASSEIVLTHGEITGFMEPMTMGYAIQPASLLEGVRAGDAVRFTIDTGQKAIVSLEKLHP